MCGRTRCCFSAPNISNITKVPLECWISKDKYQPMNNMTPGMDFPVLYHDSHHERCLRTMKWGLIPSYTKSNNDTIKYDYFKMFNARSETVESKYSFRKLIQSQRCVVVLNGYYEWKLVQGVKQPYYVTTKSQNPLYIAAIYDILESDLNTEPLYSFTILTCPANDTIRWLHERQPLILTDSQVSEWIDNRLPPNASIVHRINEISDVIHDEDQEESNLETVSHTQHLSYIPEDIISYTVTPKMTSPTYQEDDSFLPYAPRLSQTITSFFQKKSKPPPSDEEIKVDDLPVQNLLQHEIPQDIIDLTDTNSEPLIEFTSSSPSLSSTTTNDRSPKKRLRNEQGTVMDYFKKQKKKISS